MPRKASKSWWSSFFSAVVSFSAFSSVTFDDILTSNSHELNGVHLRKVHTNSPWGVLWKTTTLHSDKVQMLQQMKLLV